LDTHIERRVHATRQVMYELAARVEDWPRLLPHYRSVTLLQTAADGRRTVAMAARRDVLGERAWSGIPLGWTAIQLLDPVEPRVAFVHVAGPTRGMRVAWTFTEQPDGWLRVAIRHQFEPRWPVPPVLVRLIVGDYFVNGVAARTLRHLGRIAEARG
jgi:aromatase